VSGIATGWVGKHGPRPGDIGADGVPYGREVARSLRAVLAPIADAANAQGERSYPGLTGIMDWTFYSRTHVIKLLQRLAEDGWIRIDEQGGGRGNATVYAVTIMQRRATEKECGELTDDETPPPGNRSTGAPRNSDVTAQSVHLRVDPNGCTTEPPNGTTAAPELTLLHPPAEDKPLEQMIAERVWEQLNPKPAQPFVAVRKIAAALLKAGHKAQAIEDAMLAAPTISTRACELVLNRNRRGRAAPSVAPIITERDGPEGRIIL
jgi:hypothetical protein